jgi:hypothetical protein
MYRGVTGQNIGLQFEVFERYFLMNVDVLGIPSYASALIELWQVVRRTF